MQNIGNNKQNPLIVFLLERWYKMDNFLRRRREELNLTLEEVADYVGVSTSTVSRWETGFIR